MPLCLSTLPSLQANEIGFSAIICGQNDSGRIQFIASPSLGPIYCVKQPCSWCNYATNNSISIEQKRGEWCSSSSVMIRYMVIISFTLLLDRCPRACTHHSELYKQERLEGSMDRAPSGDSRVRKDNKKARDAIVLVWD
ncbi:hypothetical protein RRG08_043029 [Elysia crispata]|uniref:Uncharacterized protein n=1 Tax=Elysia crispata TaxID=231223 RepID=A0AAE0XXX3_9GAST|nr:hypothetical protein RRG08_043029 [Elysia crispata]